MLNNPTVSITDYSIKLWTINKHGVNLLYTLLLVALTSKPIKFQHVYIPMVFSFVYLLFTWIYFLVTDELVYKFLDWNNPGKAILLTFLFVFVCTPMSFFFFFGIYKLKQYLKQTCSSTKVVEATDNRESETKVEMLNDDNHCETTWCIVKTWLFLPLFIYSVHVCTCTYS